MKNKPVNKSRRQSSRKSLLKITEGQGIAWGCIVLTGFTVLLLASSAPGVELINNGLFEGGTFAGGLSNPLDGIPDNLLPVQWNRIETFTGGVVENSVIATQAVNGPSFPGAFGVEFSRVEVPPVPSSGDRTSIQQALNIDAASYVSLLLSIDVNVVSHNLVAGGWVAPAFEWPAFVTVNYLDQSNNPQTWRYGWYLEQPGDFPPGQVNDPGQGLIPVYNDLLVPAGAWVPNTFDLFTELPQVQTLTSIEVGGAGWDFSSLIDNVSIQGVVPEPSALLLCLIGTGTILLRRRSS